MNAPITQQSSALGGWGDRTNGGMRTRVRAGRSGRAWRPLGDLLPITELLVVRPRREVAIVARRLCLMFCVIDGRRDGSGVHDEGHREGGPRIAIPTSLCANRATWSLPAYALHGVEAPLHPHLSRRVDRDVHSNPPEEIRGAPATY